MNLVSLVKRFDLSPEDPKIFEDLQAYFKRHNLILDTKNNLDSFYESKYAVERGKDLYFNYMDAWLTDFLSGCKTLQWCIIHAMSHEDLKQSLRVFVEDGWEYLDMNISRELLEYTLEIIDFDAWATEIKKLSEGWESLPEDDHNEYLHIPGFDYLFETEIESG